MIKGVFFDLDGTLITSMHSHYIGWKTVLLNHKINLKKIEFYLNEGTKLQNLIKQIFYKNNKQIDDFLIEKLIINKNKHFLNNYKIKFYPGVLGLIDYLSNKNIYLSIVTAGTKKRVNKSLPKSFLKKFNNIITGDDYNRGKPFPDPYLKALSLSKLKANECFVYENAPLGIASAKKAKIKTVAVTNTLKKDYFSKSDYVVNSANDFKKIIINY